MDLDSIEDGPIMPNGQGGATPDEPLRTTATPDPEPEAPEPEETAETEAPEAETETPADDPIVPEAPAAAAPLELDDEAEIKIDGETVKIKDLKQGRLAHAEFTRKSQEIAREREDHFKYRVEAELRDLQTSDFVSRMDDPNEVINEFATSKPEVWEAVEDYIVQRAIHLQGLTPEGRELFLHKERQARAQWATQRDQRWAQTAKGHQTKAQARLEAQKNHGNWRNEAMKACGLNPAKDAHHDAVMDAMTSARNRGKPWTKELFDAEAARVAKILGVKAPKQPKPAPAAKAAPPAPPKPALPPVRAQGPGTPAKVAAKERTARKPRDTESFFDRLRNGE